ncbi:hypothetical protein M062_07435 [Pseudomonas aeruginosa RP73]|nr:hypothetical protein M062_07435 [Pseudomonas aeruginosa RP73]KAJ18305.1 hypothetical protein M004_26465 [Pseudomonas aeruginosa M10]
MLIAHEGELCVMELMLAGRMIQPPVNRHAAYN